MKRSSRKNFSGELEQGLDEWETDTLLTYPQPLAALYTEWMDNDFSFWDSIRGTVEKTVANRRRISAAARSMSMGSRLWK